MLKLLSDLVGPFNGRPILVIGGGPSTAINLKHIPADYPACVISANGHGFKQDKFKVDFIVNVDFTYASTRTPMQEYLAQFGKPTINRWSWADYRIPEWTFNGDSGLTAIAVAVMLGGHPVVPLGMDRYTGPKRYFWEPEPEKGWDRRKAPNIDNVREHTRQCVHFCHAAQVRMFDGPMRAYWPVFNHPVEELPAWQPCRAAQCTLEGKVYMVQQSIFLHPTDRVEGGTQIRLTDKEAHPHLRQKKVTLLEVA
jgi:hypothetical protein